MKTLTELSKTLDSYYVKLPALPKGLKDFIVTVSPWLALIFGILAIISGVAAFGTISFLSPFAVVAGVGGYAITVILSTLILLAQGVIELLAFPALKIRKAKGWDLLFYSLVLGFLSSIVTLSVGSIIGSLLGALIGYYFLYQIKSFYK